MPKGWSNAARSRGGAPLGRADAPCWGCGVTGCTECGPSPEADSPPAGLAVTDEADDADDDGEPILGPLTGYELYALRSLGLT